MKHLKAMLKEVSVFLLLAALSFESISQDQKIDSLRSLLPKRSGVEYVDLLFEISRYFPETQNEISFKYASEASNKAKIIGDTLRIVRTGRLRSQLLRQLGEIDSAIQLYKEILLIAERHNFVDEIGASLNGLGVMYFFLANYDKALEYFFESLRHREIDGDKLGTVIAFNNIGLVYQNLQDYDQALSYYNKSLGRK